MGAKEQRRNASNDHQPPTILRCCRFCGSSSGVERNLAKVDVVGSNPISRSNIGGLAEWFNAPVLKTDEGESLPRVRIPEPPP